MSSSAFNFKSWSEGFQALRKLAVASRGLDPSCIDEHDERRWPETTCQDVYAISLVFAQAVDGLDAKLYEYWLDEAQAVFLACGGRGTYPGNRSFWPMLSRIALHLDHDEVAIALPGLWANAVAKLIEPYAEVSEVPDHDPNGAEAAKPTWRSMAQEQVSYFADLRGVLPRCRPGQLTPRTLNADVMQLAVYWTAQLVRDGAIAFPSNRLEIFGRWADVLQDVATIAARAAQRDVYPCNDDFWEAVLELASAADPTAGAPAPCHLRIGTHEPSEAPRNAAAASDTAQLAFPLTATLDAAADAQRRLLGARRGEDRRPLPYSRIPRTTNADVAQLAAHWVEVEHRIYSKYKIDRFSRRVRDRWQAAVTNVEVATRDADPRAVYAHNAEFWPALLSMSVELAVTAEAPQPWGMYVDAFEDRFERAMTALSRAPDVIPEAINDALKKGLEALEGAGASLLRALVWPAVIVGGGAILWVTSRREASAPARSPS